MNVLQSLRLNYKAMSTYAYFFCPSDLFLDRLLFPSVLWLCVESLVLLDRDSFMLCTVMGQDSLVELGGHCVGVGDAACFLRRKQMDKNYVL